MGLRFLRFIDLPAHAAPGGFDHAAVCRADGRLYIAHTANDALNVVDCPSDRYLHCIPGLTGVAGAIVSDGTVLTSNRGEDTVGFFRSGDERNLFKVSVGVRPNGISFDPRRGILLAANVGDPDVPGSTTLSIVDVGRRKMTASIPAPGRTRWTVFDAADDVFYVNIADPALILVVDAGDPKRVARSMPVPAAGPHGLDLDGDRHRLFCASDAGKLVALDARSGEATATLDLSGVPDAVVYNAALARLYAAVADPGVIDVFDTEAMRLLESVPTEKGTHTIAFDADRGKVYAFLPQTHRAAVFQENPW